jgi:hypothetical protein
MIYWLPAKGIFLSVQDPRRRPHMVVRACGDGPCSVPLTREQLRGLVELEVS